MNGPRQSLLNKRLPSLLSLFCVVIAFVAILWTSTNSVMLGSNAAGGSAPHDVRITNITDTQFTVSYTTDASVLGTISYGQTEKLGTLAMDNRDKSAGNPNPHSVHAITVNGLQPSTTYLFTITSGDSIYLQNNHMFTVTTGAALAGSSHSSYQITGWTKTDEGKNPQEAIAYLTVNGTQPLSFLLRSNGGYSFSLSQTRTTDLANYATLSTTTPATLEITTATLHSTIHLLVGSASLLPIITLGKNYDFTLSPPTQNVTPTASGSGFPVFNQPNDNGSLQLTSPQLQKGLQDQQPVFQGTAPPNSKVKITIHSSEAMTATVQTDSKGHWEYRPTKPLSAGQHTITVSVFDLSGLLQTITHPFTVFTLGSQFTAPSVSPAQTATTTPVPTVKPSPTPTPKPTSKLTSSLSPTTKPTATPTPKLVAKNVITPTLSPTATPTPKPNPTKAVNNNSINSEAITSPTTPPTATPIPVKPLSNVSTLESLPKNGSMLFDIGVIVALIVITIGTILFFAMRRESSG